MSISTENYAQKTSHKLAPYSSLDANWKELGVIHEKEE